jgi:hypothetical protein
MKVIKLLFITIMLVSFGSFAQEKEVKEEPKLEEHANINKFRQLYQEFSTPNQYRSASGAPGPKYYQQRADYEMDIRLDDENHHLYGYGTILQMCWIIYGCSWIKICVQRILKRPLLKAAAWSHSCNHLVLQEHI